MTNFRLKCKSFIFISLWPCLLTHFGQAWSIPYVKNSKTMPSVKVVLEPPEDPLPQVSAAIQDLEKERLKTEESLMSRLEDVYNDVLDKSQHSIEDTLSKTMAIFEDRTFLETVVRGSLQQISPSNGLRTKKNLFKFEQRFTNLTKNIKEPLATKTQSMRNETMSQNQTEFLDQNIAVSLSKDKSKKPSQPRYAEGKLKDKANVLAEKRNLLNSVIKTHLKDGPLDFLSFLQLSLNERNSLKSASGAGITVGVQSHQQLPWKNIASNVLKKLENSAAPSVNVEVVDLFEPDPAIEKKMSQMEEKRNDEEGKMFELAAQELSLLTNIMEEELKTNIQIQMNVFLADAESVKKTVESISRQLFLPKSAKFTQVFSYNRSKNSWKYKAQQRCEKLKSKFPSLKLNCGKSRKQRSNGSGSSFLQIHSELKTEDASQSLIPEQLNVRIGSSEHAYPTVDQLVDNMEKRRDATERLERAKILELHVNLMRAQIEMIKDALHVRLARIMALYGSVTDAIKEESLYAKIR